MPSFVTPFPFGWNPNTGYDADLIIGKAYPGLVLDAYDVPSGEILGAYTAVREVNGTLYVLTNADWNGTGFQQTDATKTSEAISIGPGGLFYLTAPAGAPTPITWTSVSLGQGFNNPFFNVKDFGAVGDGSTDDTAACQAAINAAQNNGGGCVLWPSGCNTLISSTLNITLPNGITIAGVNTQSSAITAAADFDILYVNGAHGTGLTFKDILLQGSSASGNTVNYLGTAINIGGSAGNVQSVTDTRFYNVTTNGVAYGFKFYGGGGRNVMYGCKFVGDYVGGIMYGHGIKCLGDTINGGTYALILDGGADPKMFECPLFGVLCILSMNTTGVYKGGTVYLYDVESNYGPPPATQKVAATGQFQFSGSGPTTGHTFTLTVSGNTVTVNEYTGTFAAQAISTASQMNAYFNDPNNFPNNPGDFQSVTFAASGNNVNMTATEAGYGGNDIKYFGTDSATVTVSPHSKTNFTGGSDNGLYPGDNTGGPYGTGDIWGQVAAGVGLTVGSGGYLLGGDHAQCNIVTNWVKNGIVFGDSGTVRASPQFIDVVGGNIGQAVKGKSQISTYALDFQNVGQFKVTAVAINQGGETTGAAIHIPNSTLCTAGGIIYGNRFKIGDGNFAINGTDNTAEIQICANTFDQINGTTATGGMIQQGGVTSGPPFGNTSANNWIAYGNFGFNPFGYLETKALSVGTTTYTNVYGMPVMAYVVGGGTITSVSLNTPAGGFQNTGQATGGATGGGGYFLWPGQQIRVVAAGSPGTILFFAS